MKTPYLDKEIEWMSGDPQKHIEQLKEFKAIKEALSIHSVSSSLDDCWNSEEDDHWDEYEDPNVIND